MSRPRMFADPEACAEAILERAGREIVLGLPLGIGKANHIANALYERARRDPAIRLRIFTALTLEHPRPRAELERRFLAPIAERLFAGYPALAYATALRKGELPRNVEVHEFYFPAGRWLDQPRAQQSYVSVNYTHAARAVLDLGVNVVAQLVARRQEPAGPRYSLGSNPDITLDLLPHFAACRRSGRAVVLAGQVNSALPFMTGEAALDPSAFDVVLEDASCDFPLFGVPKEEVSLGDHAIGLHVASLIADGGTLQIGIGSLGDAVVYALLLRQSRPELFRRLIVELDPSRQGFEWQPFREGLFGLSEMFVDGFLELRRAGILKRCVPAPGSAGDRQDRGTWLQAGFFLGSHAFYEQLCGLAEEERDGIAMTSVSWTNQLYGAEERKRQERRHARFINETMMVTLLGEAVSETLDDGRVVSGIGGQHDFIAQAHALPDARAILVLNSTRQSRGSLRSNILWQAGRIAVPRHLRDMVVTEFGVADLRGRSDRDVIAAVLGLAHARFQPELARAAIRAGKLEPGYAPERGSGENTGDRIAQVLGPRRAEGLFPAYPFGSDLTPVEQRLARALKRLKQLAGRPLGLAGLLAASLRPGSASDADRECLARLGLDRPASFKEWMYHRLVLAALAATVAEE